MSDFIAHENVDKRIEIEQAIRQLGHTDRAVLYLWVIGYTQAEIGVMFGYSQARISQILKKICKE
ncbi:MAG: sigma factor-like helix-turn-helix DNA-binding protein [Synergistaceae bacterium]